MSDETVIPLDPATAITRSPKRAHEESPEPDMAVVEAPAKRPRPDDGVDVAVAPAVDAGVGVAEAKDEVPPAAAAPVLEAKGEPLLFITPNLDGDVCMKVFYPQTTPKGTEIVAAFGRMIDEPRHVVDGTEGMAMQRTLQVIDLCRGSDGKTVREVLGKFPTAEHTLVPAIFLDYVAHDFGDWDTLSHDGSVTATGGTAMYRLKYDA